MAEKNWKDAKAQFIIQTEELNQEVAGHAEQLQTSKTEVTDLCAIPSRVWRSSCSLSSAESHPERHTGGNRILLWSPAGIDPDADQQHRSQLSDVHADIKRQNLEYLQFMDTKTWLEQEIITYCSLHEGQDAYYNSLPTTQST